MAKPRSLSLRLPFLLVFLGCTGLPLATLSLRFVPGTTYKFAYKTEASVNGPDDSAARGRKDVGIGLHASVEATCVWSDDSGTSQLVRLVAHGASTRGLSLEGSGSLRAEQLFRQPAFFLLEQRVVTRAFVPEEQRLSANIYRGMMSLFQVDNENGEDSMEEDASGSCRVTYEREGEYKLVKLKKDCLAPDSLEYTNVNKVLGVERHSWSRTEYSFAGDFVLSIKSQELHEVVTALGDAIAVVASSQQLSLVEEEPSRSGPMSGSLDQVVDEIGREHKKLTESLLRTALDGEECKYDCIKLSQLVHKIRSSLTSSFVGRPNSSATFQTLVTSFRSSNRKEILEVLRMYKKEEVVFFTLLDAACSSQTSASVRALRGMFDFERDDVRSLERFLLASALTTHPSDELLLYLLELSSLRLSRNELQESVEEALAAVLFTYSKLPKHDAKIVERVSNVLLNHLDDCKEDLRCQLVSVRALSNAGIRPAAARVVTLAERSESPEVGEACLKALRRFDVQSIQAEFRDRLRDIFHQRRRSYGSVVRSQALKLLLRMGLSEEEVERIFGETRDPWNEEYALYVRSMLFDEARRDPKLRSHLERRVFRNSSLNNYHVLASSGKSLSFSSHLLDSPKIEYLMYVENGRSGAMKRSGMDVDLHHANLSLPLYKFELFAAGLGSLLGNGKQDDDEAEVTAGMSLDMMGISLRPTTFFVGQGGLMSAIWNAPSEPTSALQINFLLQDHRESVRLGNGLHVKVDVTGVVSLDLSCSLSVSLWNKNAQSLVRNSGSLSLKTDVRLETSLFRSSLERLDELELGLDFKTDVDFYDEAKMCLQMTRPRSLLRRQVIKREWLNRSPKSFLSRAVSRAELPGVSYPMPRSNDDKCRALFPTGSQ